MVKPFVSVTSPSEMAHESSASNTSPNSSPKKSRNGLKSHNKDKKNPYSNRGLDKFSALLTDLEEKRQKIYSQSDPENIVLVRFAYKNSNECVPVVVKQKDKNEDKPGIVNVKDKHIGSSEAVEKLPIEPSTSEKESKRSRLETQKKAKKKSFVNLNSWRKPSYYFTAIVIFILLMLSVFGRSVTILCTSLLWYSVPVLKGSSKSRSPTQRKEYARTSTEKKMAAEGSSSPKNNSSEDMKDKSPRSRGQRKSL